MTKKAIIKGSDGERAHETRGTIMVTFVVNLRTDKGISQTITVQASNEQHAKWLAYLRTDARVVGVVKIG